MKSMLFVIVSIIAVTSTETFARSEVCHAATQQQIASLFDRWNRSLQTGDPKESWGQLRREVGPASYRIEYARLTPEAREDYFKHFLENHPVGNIDSRTIEIDCNTAIDAGLYTFTFGDGVR